MEHKRLRRSKVAEAVRGEIAKQGVSRVQLAAAIGLSTDALRRRLKGDKPFYVDELVDICHALNIPVSVMLDRAGIK